MRPAVTVGEPQASRLGHQRNRIAHALVSLLACVALFPGIAHAHEFYAGRVPRQATAMSSDGLDKPCITCHNNPDGGSGCVDSGGSTPCLNPFGESFRAGGFLWSADLAMMDSDGDGFTNGQELQEPTGTWELGQPRPGNPDYVTRPGFASDSPGQTDGDGDGYCWFGQDLDDNGDCLGAGENNGSLDCNDAASDVNSGQTERCDDEIDADCNGLTTLEDPACAAVVDRDGDGFCPMGRDMDRDANCLDPGENTADMDCNDDNITVFPGASENCIDTFDNNCDGATDRADAMCNGETDADDDGYCPVGRDLNDDGDCLDTGEEDAGFDCDDMDPNANPGETEICSDAIDNDCDGRPNFLDDECATVFDGDLDGHCPAGVDMNGDGDCADEGEGVEPFDCNDDDARISPSATELCTNGGDDDCDTFTDLTDEDCVGYLDRDGDRYCFVGFDMNQDGDCADAGEEGGGADCDDDNPMASPEFAEMCLNGFDDNCDGSRDGRDPVCAPDYFDYDGDGYCQIGRDGDGDGTCDGEGEQEGPGDLARDDPSIYPGAPENCIDRKDNDQDGDVDTDDADCSREVDADMDGYCPLGQDLNGDGDCLDEGENLAVSDCDDGDAERNPAAEELCTNGGRDDDCDAEADLFDEDCVHLLDRDRDGFCGMGIDDNDDGDCLDLDEDRFGEDCDDENPLVGPRAREICDDNLDNDCDGNIDVQDSQCDCTDDAACDDGDACTVDRCADDGNGCVYEPSPMCVDAGVMDAGPMPEGDDGCGCSAAGAGGTKGAWWLFGLAGVMFARRRRR